MAYFLFLSFWLYVMMTIQVDLLLGKAYSDWGHISDAVSVYDQIIFSHPDDFRGYLAKVLQFFLVTFFLFFGLGQLFWDRFYKRHNLTTHLPNTKKKKKKAYYIF